VNPIGLALTYRVIEVVINSLPYEIKDYSATAGREQHCFHKVPIIEQN